MGICIFRIHPQISGRTDQLLRADIMPLYELDEAMFREASGQRDNASEEYITLAQFRQSERYWFRFMDHWNGHYGMSLISVQKH